MTIEQFHDLLNVIVPMFETAGLRLSLVNVGEFCKPDENEIESVHFNCQPKFDHIEVTNRYIHISKGTAVDFIPLADPEFFDKLRQYINA